ncbi:diguanylate cyclase (GGDEF) domain-containing protein [Noviherbaspirillum humi]|uniref:diguanylate cyclase n=1 Tax=Noviherbaspirillum humi TaxID=1688639 RepID=A0A239LE35_9BURK|nr:GGDEF domain-containing protein [Noviherbaspirillum humi]SNT27794.1 diguanylate cyclase (GGDEF) domain-containing protein [Noviherbaspirillum humi]
MNSLLHHLDRMTRRRERGLLVAALLDALRDLTDAEQADLFDVIGTGDRLHLQRHESANLGTARRADADVLPANRISVLIASNEPAPLLAVGPAGVHQLWQCLRAEQGGGTVVRLNRARPFSADDLELVGGVLQIFRNHLAQIEYGETDSLTGLLNRKTFDSRFDQLVSECLPQDASGAPEGSERREAGPVQSNWLAVVDIDHFKRINDTYGHLYGDEVLILLANILKRSFRAKDRIFRFGGEEFVILLRSTVPRHARIAFERFRLAVAAQDFPQVGKVTVSVGYAEISTASPVVILGDADRALYYAKQNGRNRVCRYEELVKVGSLRPQKVSGSVELF